jgi:hypothetical protein
MSPNDLTFSTRFFYPQGVRVDFLNGTKTTFSNEGSIYIHIGARERHSMFETIASEPQYSYPQPELTFQPNLISSPVSDFPPHFTGGVYSQTRYEFTKPEVKSEPTLTVVYEEEGAIVVKLKQLEISKPYFIRLNQKNYAVVMPKEGIIDLYELED